MKAFLFVDRLGSELTPLNEHYCVAMLPLAGKPIVAYTLDELARAGLREVVVIACHGAREVADYLGSGERWGMVFEYFPSRGEEQPAAVLRRYGHHGDDAFIVSRGDVLRTGTATFIERARQSSAPVVAARIGGVDAGLCFCRGAGSLSALALPYAPGSSVEPREWLEVDHARYAPLDSLADFHRASLDLASGQFDTFTPAGWAHRPGLVVGPGSRFAAGSIDASHSYIGRLCRVHAKAQLRGRVVIDERCFIDRGATIEDSVILPGTYVGENLHVKNALVCGKQILRVDSGASFTVTDPYLLSTMESGLLRRGMRDAGNRLLGLLALLLSLPLWPIALAVSLLNPLRKPLFARHYISNKRSSQPGSEWQTREFTTWLWQAPAPVLRYLPLLLAVISGHLNLWGARPQPVGAKVGGMAPWERGETLMGCGLLGPVQLVLPPDAPPEECLLAEIQYSGENSVKLRLFYLGKAFASLFSARAWVSPPSTAH